MGDRRRVLGALLAAGAIFAAGCGQAADTVQTEVGAPAEPAATASAPQGDRVPDPADPRVRVRQVEAERGADQAGFYEGSTFADLVYTPIEPCRIIDTRGASFGGDMAANETRSFYVADFDTPEDTAAAFATQGGNQAGCTVPFGAATSVMLNFTMVSPQGTGFLRAWPYGSTPPQATLVNFNKTLNVSNGIAVPICDPFFTPCQQDLTVKTFGAATDLVVDVVGYFGYSLPPEIVNPVTETLAADVNQAIGPTCTAFHGAATPPAIDPFWSGSIVVEGHATVRVQHTLGVADTVTAWAGHVQSDLGTPVFDGACGADACPPTPATVAASEATGEVVLNIPVRCEIALSLADLDAGATFTLEVNGTASGGAATVDRLTYTATYTPTPFGF